jgi:hypothetical protein
MSFPSRAGRAAAVGDAHLEIGTRLQHPAEIRMATTMASSRITPRLLNKPSRGRARHQEVVLGLRVEEQHRGHRLGRLEERQNSGSSHCLSSPWAGSTAAGRAVPSRVASRIPPAALPAPAVLRQRRRQRGGAALPARPGGRRPPGARHRLAVRAVASLAGHVGAGTEEPHPGGRRSASSGATSKRCSGCRAPVRSWPRARDERPAC